MITSLEQLEGYFYSFSCDIRGCRVIQTLFDSYLNKYSEKIASSSSSSSSSSLSVFPPENLSGIYLFFNEIKLNIGTLSKDSSGNFVFQKFLGFFFVIIIIIIIIDCCDKIKELNGLLLSVCEAILPDVFSLSFNMYGCRVVEKVLSFFFILFFLYFLLSCPFPFFLFFFSIHYYICSVWSYLMSPPDSK
jgi:hypothetical protein